MKNQDGTYSAIFTADELVAVYRALATWIDVLKGKQGEDVGAASLLRRRQIVSALDAIDEVGTMVTESLRAEVLDKWLHSKE